MSSMLNSTKIRELRAARKLSLTEAAVKAGWGTSGRTRWWALENGDRVGSNITLQTLEQLAVALGCEISELVISG